MSNLKQDPLVETIFCRENKDNLVLKIISHTVTFLVLLGLAVLILKYYRRRKDTPIRERAPLLSIFQMIGFFGLFFIMYLTEIYIEIDSNFYEHDKNYIRCITKAFYISLRVVTYMLFVLR